MKSFSLTAVVLAAMAAPALAAKHEETFAVLHFDNQPMCEGRLDPIVSPDQTSAHVHMLMGGNGLTSSSTGASLKKDSTCTNAQVKEDLSNYWVPQLYYHNKDEGTFEAVDLFYMNVYYFFDTTDDDIKAFPTGLQIVSGDAMIRSVPDGGVTSNEDPTQGPISPAKITCPRSSYNPPSYPVDSDGSMAGIVNPNNDGEGIGFPFANCDGYASPLRVDIQFPSCYNPDKALDDFENNMVWPTIDNNVHTCPDGHIHTPHLFFETYWNTPDWADKWNPGGDSQPFVFANGDVTGYSAHGDFMAAWDEDVLQTVIDGCNQGTSGLENCAGVTKQTFSDDNRCKCPAGTAPDEKISGKMTKLAGDNPLAGWSYGNSTGGGMGGGDSGSSSSMTDSPSSTKPSLPSDSAPVTTQAENPGKPSKTSSSDAASQTGDDDDSGMTMSTSAGNAMGSVPTHAPAPQPLSSSGTSKSMCSKKHKTVWETVTVTSKRPSATSGSSSESGGTNSTVGDFTYAGCFKDGSDRVMGNAEMMDGKVSNDNCVSHCKDAGYSLAATEYGGECYCGNELDGSEQLDESKCDTSCAGDMSQTCGGSFALSVYSADGNVSLKNKKARRVAREHMLHHRSHQH